MPKTEIPAYAMRAIVNIAKALDEVDKSNTRESGEVPYVQKITLGWCGETMEGVTLVLDEFDQYAVRIETKENN